MGVPHVVWTLPVAVSAIALSGCPRGASPAGAGPTSHEVSLTSYGERPERLERRTLNPFVGSWGPGPGYVANDWTVRFTPDGRVSVVGPGMSARGTYSASSETATATYALRDGTTNLSKARKTGLFHLDSDRQELDFVTGIPNDPPIRLVPE